MLDQLGPDVDDALDGFLVLEVGVEVVELDLFHDLPHGLKDVDVRGEALGVQQAELLKEADKLGFHLSVGFCDVVESGALVNVVALGHLAHDDLLAVSGVEELFEHGHVPCDSFSECVALVFSHDFEQEGVEADKFVDFSEEFVQEPGGFLGLVHEVADAFDEVVLVGFVWLGEDLIQDVDHL